MTRRHLKGPEFETSTSATTYTASDPESALPDTTSTVVTAGVYEIAHGANTSSFYRKMRSGELIPFTAYANHKVSFERSGARSFRSTHNSSGTWQQADTSNWMYLSAPAIGEESFAVDYELIDSYRNVAKEKVQSSAANIYDEGHDVLTSLSELHKTREMFMNLGYRMGRLRDVFKKYLKNKEMTREQVERLYATWLEGRYGWRTLMYEIESLNSYVHRIKRGKSYDRLVKQSTASEDFYTVVNSSGIVNSTWSWTSEKKTTTRIELVGRVSADLALALTTLNPVVTSWELIRFSFVIDWMISVGNAIKASSLALLADNYTASCGYKIVTVEQTDLICSPRSELYPNHSITGFGNASRRIEREVLLREPTELVSRPYAKVRLNALKVMDLIALLERARPSTARL